MITKNDRAAAAGGGKKDLKNDAGVDHFFGAKVDQFWSVANTGHAEGWAHYLGRLAQVAAGRDPGPDPWHRRTGRE